MVEGVTTPRSSLGPYHGAYGTSTHDVSRKLTDRF